MYNKWSQVKISPQKCINFLSHPSKKCPDKMPHNVAFHLSLHSVAKYACIQKSVKMKSAPSIFPNFSFYIVKEMWDRSAETNSNYLINLMAAATKSSALTLEAPITSAADDKFCDIFPNFK